MGRLTFNLWSLNKARDDDCYVQQYKVYILFLEKPVYILFAGMNNRIESPFQT